MKYFLLCLLLLAGNRAFAQDYAPLPDTGIRRYFTNSAGYLRGIRVDSVVQESGYKRYVTFKTPRGRNNNSGNFTDSSGACWLGKNVRAYANGDWYFPNSAGDTILIKTGARVGDTWAFHRDMSVIWTEAKVLSTDTQTVFGILDSVKRIQLTLKNGNVALPLNPISAFQIVLSKTRGFAQVPDLHLFPYKDLDSGYNVRDYWYSKLKPNSNNVSITESLIFNDVSGWNLSEREMYDLQVGDVTYRGHFWNMGPNNDYFLDTVTARQDFSTYTDYVYNRWFWRRSANQYGPTLSVQHGVATARFTDKPLFDTTYMPEEYWGGCYNTFYVRPNDTSFCNKSLLVEKTEGDGCGLYMRGLIYPREYKYKKNLGLVYHRYGDGDGQQISDDFYSYLKNGVLCGTIPSVPSSVKNISLKSTDFKIYPQPATTEVFLEAPQLRYPATVRIQNLQGQLLSTQELSAAGKPISTASLPAGLYLLLVTDAGGNNEVRKLIVAP